MNRRQFLTTAAVSAMTLPARPALLAAPLTGKTCAYADFAEYLLRQIADAHHLPYDLLTVPWPPLEVADARKSISTAVQFNSLVDRRIKDELTGNTG